MKVQNILDFFKRNNFREIVFIISLSLFTFIFPIEPLFSQGFLYILVIVSLFSFKSKTDNKGIITVSFFLFLIYFVYILGILISEPNFYGKSLSTKLILAIVPIIFLFNEKIISKYKAFINIVFIGGIFISVIVLISKSYFSGDGFLLAMKTYSFHHTYMSMTFIYGVILMMDSMIKDKLSRKVRLIYIGLILLFASAIYLSGSRVGILVFLEVVLLSILFSYKNKKMISVSLGLFIVAILLLVNNPRLTSTAKVMKKSISEVNKIEEFEGSIVRLNIWKESFELIKKRPFVGYGTGKERKVLYDRYVKSECDACKEYVFNAHNQILSTLIEVGVVGALAILGLIGYLLIYSVKNRNFETFAFVFSISNILMIESIMNRFTGLVLFSFFLLYSLTKKVSEP